MSSRPPATSPGGGVSWQVDTTNLSQLILGAEGQGLKQLALAGVDVHAIGCVLMIGEYTPASTTFRQSLSRCRQAQRAERIWMFKMVGKGSGHSFLTENLLNTENMMALMTAIIAVMPEQAYVSVLYSLFEASGAGANDVPGLGQLTNIRNALLPLAREMDFKERVIQYHSFLWSLLQPGGPPSGNDPFERILEISSIPAVIDVSKKSKKCELY
jgi:hypothetical protein